MSEATELARRSLKTAKISNCISLVGLIAAVVSVLLVYRTLSDANTNFQADKRPWIGVELPFNGANETKVFEEIRAGQRVEWLLPWKNYGNSPALDVHEHLQLILSGPGPRGWDGQVDWKSIQNQIETLSMPPEISNQLFNGQTLPGHGASDAEVDEATANRLKTSLQHAILGGRVIYYDEFHSRHETTICVMYNPPDNIHPAGWFQCPLRTIAE